MGGSLLICGTGSADSHTRSVARFPAIRSNPRQAGVGRMEMGDERSSGETENRIRSRRLVPIRRGTDRDLSSVLRRCLPGPTPSSARASHRPTSTSRSTLSQCSSEPRHLHEASVSRRRRFLQIPPGGKRAAPMTQQRGRSAEPGPRSCDRRVHVLARRSHCPVSCRGRLLLAPRNRRLQRRFRPIPTTTLQRRQQAWALAACTVVDRPSALPYDVWTSMIRT